MRRKQFLAACTIAFASSRCRQLTEESSHSSFLTTVTPGHEMLCCELAEEAPVPIMPHTRQRDIACCAYIWLIQPECHILQS